jgi:hypothetical protein
MRIVKAAGGPTCVPSFIAARERSTRSIHGLGQEGMQFHVPGNRGAGLPVLLVRAARLRSNNAPTVSPRVARSAFFSFAGSAPSKIRPRCWLAFLLRHEHVGIAPKPHAPRRPWWR